jgi:site-specific recombinase XerD
MAFPQHQQAANDAVITRARCRTLPIAHTVSTIQGYPTKLKIFQTAASRYWQVRCFFAPSAVIRSLRTQNKQEAIARAKAFYDQELMTRSQHLLKGSAAWHPPEHSVEAAVALLITHEAGRLARAEITQQSFQITSQRARGEIAAHFKNTAIQRIDRSAIERFVSHLSATGVRASTIKAYLVVLRKLLTRCLHQEWIDRVPAFPTVKAPTNPRGHFTVVEYLRLLRAAKQLRPAYTEPPTRAASHRSTRGGIFTATQGVPWEMAWLIGFMVNSFVRPVDAKVIQHKHVEIVRGERCYLRLRLPETKRHAAQIITMPAAVHIYERLRAYQWERGLAGPDHYLFLPRVEDRGAAIWLLDRYFGKILDHTGLRAGARGQRRTLYSLRHSAITFRLLYGEGIDLLTLARNARTSLEMVDKFYASELSAEMNVAMLHSRR